MGVIDVFGLKPADQRPLAQALCGYDSIVTLEEGFIKRGGLDAFIARVIAENGGQAKLTSLGVDGRYLFELGGRERLHRICGIDEEGILRAISASAARVVRAKSAGGGVRSSLRGGPADSPVLGPCGPHVVQPQAVTTRSDWKGRV